MKWVSESFGVAGTVLTLIGTVYAIVQGYPDTDPLVVIVASVIVTVLLIIFIYIVIHLGNIVIRYLKPKKAIDLQPTWIPAKKLEPKDLLKGRPYKQYRPRQEDDVLRKLILEKKNVLVKGSPLAGKTRTVFEVVKSLGKSVNVFISHPEDIKSDDFFPKNRKKNIEVVILDDLDRFVEIGIFEKLMAIISDKNLVVVATCQTGDPFNLVKSKLVDKRLDLETIFGKNIIDIGDITKDEARQIAKNEKINWKDTEFDGTIGSIFLQLGEMKNRYNALDETEKDLLKTIKKLQIAGIYEGKHIFPHEWIEAAFNANYPDTKFHWEHVLTSLKSSELVSVPEEEKIHVEEVYLEKIVEFNNPKSEITIFNEMLNVFSDQPDVLNEIGVRASSFSLIRTNKVDFAKTAIKAYKDALKVYTFDESPMKYAMIQNNLGIAYGNMADVEDKRINLKEAIKAYEEALRVRNITKFPIDYATTQNNLGVAYSNLADVEDRINNLNKAITAYKEVLKVCTFTKFPIEYATAQNNIGVTYKNLAEMGDKIYYYKKAIGAYEEALKVRAIDKFPMDYAMTQGNLGNLYSNICNYLTDVQDKKKYLLDAVIAYGEALNVYNFDEFPIQYGAIQNNRGAVYDDLADVQDNIKNLKEAIKAYKEALKVRIIDKFPMDYAQTQNNIGVSYRKLAAVEDTKVNLFKAITAYKEALKFRTQNNLPLDYAQTQNNIGFAFIHLSSIVD